MSWAKDDALQHRELEGWVIVELMVEARQQCVAHVRYVDIPLSMNGHQETVQDVVETLWLSMKGISPADKFYVKGACARSPEMSINILEMRAPRQRCMDDHVAPVRRHTGEDGLDQWSTTSALGVEGEFKWRAAVHREDGTRARESSMSLPTSTSLTIVFGVFLPTPTRFFVSGL
ncbi:hypothetical protein BS17DRAFT_767166 [Gyrodon lividus]|nr:hypothetical protein BS17DRAFT_767166 [Gyrodon lividus]